MPCRIFVGVIGRSQHEPRPGSDDTNGISREDVHNPAMSQALQTRDGLVSSWMIFAVACALVVVGAKCWLIAQYGSPTPYWDQWDAEGAILYAKFFGGTLHFFDLIAPHNEHRILTARLWWLLLLELNGYWDPILQMLANTAIIAAFLSVTVVAFHRILDGTSWIAFVIFSAVLFALPFDWESALWGVESQKYLVLLFSVAGLVAISVAAAFKLRWWLAILLLVISYFSTAAGALSTAASFAVCFVQFAVARRSGRSELLALVFLAAVTVVMALYTPVLPGHAPLKAHSIEQFLRALMDIASWPATTGHEGAVVLLLGTILTQAPLVVVSIRIVWLRPPLNDRCWLLVAFAGLAVLQSVTLAYGRAADPTASRYINTFVITLIINYACLLYLLNKSELELRKRLVMVATAIWLLLVLFGASKFIFTQTLPDLARKEAQSRAQTANLHAYLDTGNIAALENKPFLDIPYPSPQRLAMIVSQPAIRAILPPALVGDASAARAQQRGLARFTGRPIEALKNYALRWGVLLIPAGLTLFLLGLTMRWWRDAEISPSIVRPDAG